MGNFIWTFNDQGVANPFVIQSFAFNFADVLLWLSVPFVAAFFAWGLALRIDRNRPHRDPS